MLCVVSVTTQKNCDIDIRFGFAGYRENEIHLFSIDIFILSIRTWLLL